MLWWKQKSKVPEAPSIITQSIFSLCKKLVSHFLVCSWLRVVTALLKWYMSVVTKGWDNKACDATLKHIIYKTVTRVHQEDPVKENWFVSGWEYWLTQDLWLQE